MRSQNSQWLVFNFVGRDLTVGRERLSRYPCGKASMKPGRVKRFRVDWFTLLFEFPRLPFGFYSWSQSTVRRSSFLAYEVCASALPRAVRHFNQFPNLLPT